MNEGVLHGIPGMVEIRGAGGAENAAAAGLGPGGGGVEEFAEGLRGEGFQVVEDDEGGGAREDGAGGLRVEEAFSQFAAEVADGHGDRVGALQAGVVHEDAGLELPEAGEPAAGFLREGGLALAAEAGEGDPARLVREPALEMPQLHPPPEEAGLGAARGGWCGAWERRAAKRRAPL